MEKNWRKLIKNWRKKGLNLEKQGEMLHVFVQRTLPKFVLSHQFHGKMGGGVVKIFFS
jgi:ribosomal protein L21E